eukprot:scaffold1026_cov409-Prasinococcus_capsulatus_cf.AAC.29
MRAIQLSTPRPHEMSNEVSNAAEDKQTANQKQDGTRTMELHMKFSELKQEKGESLLGAIKRLQSIVREETNFNVHRPIGQVAQRVFDLFPSDPIWEHIRRPVRKMVRTGMIRNFSALLDAIQLECGYSAIDLNAITDRNAIITTGVPTSWSQASIMTATANATRHETAQGSATCHFCQVAGHTKAHCPALALLRAIKTKFKDNQPVLDDIHAAVADWKDSLQNRRNNSNQPRRPSGSETHVSLRSNRPAGQSPNGASPSANVLVA